MIKQLMANVRVNIKFYRRNRLLIVVRIFLLVIMGLVLVPAIIFGSITKMFDVTKMAFNQMSGFTVLIIAAFGIMAVSHHLNNRNIKMVITKPCPIETWLLSQFVSAIMVCAVLFAAIFIMVAAMFIIWKMPFQWGVVYLTFYNFFTTIILLSYVIFLTVMLSPVMAVLITLVFKPETFYYLLILIMSGLKNAESAFSVVMLSILKTAFYVLYMFLPVFNPFSEEIAGIRESFIVSSADLKYLLYTLIYTIVISSFFYFLSCIIIKRKRYI